MGLGISIYFYGGGSESGQRKVLDVFRKYQERYGEYLKGMFGGGGGSKFMQYTPQRFIEHISKLRGFAEKDKRISFSMGSDRWGDYADDYACETLTTSPTGESVYNLLSYLRLVFPIGWLKDESEYEGRSIGNLSTFMITHWWTNPLPTVKKPVFIICKYSKSVIAAKNWA